MSKYVDVEPLIQYAQEKVTAIFVYPQGARKEDERAERKAWRVVLDYLVNVKESDVVERKKGTWIEVGDWSEGGGMGEVYGNYFKCSVCEKRVQGGYRHCYMNFCPNCGAKMDL